MKRQENHALILQSREQNVCWAFIKIIHQPHQSRVRLFSNWFEHYLSLFERVAFPTNRSYNPTKFATRLTSDAKGCSTP